jgi:hypothetical protein
LQPRAGGCRRRAGIQHRPRRDPRAGVRVDGGKRLRPAGRVDARARGRGGRARDRGDRVLEAARYAGFAAGPLLAAGLTALGPWLALLINAASFLAIAAAAGATRARRLPGPSTATERSRPLDGLRLLHSDRDLRVTIGAAVGALLFISAALTVEIFYLKDVVGASDSAYALLVCVWMAGMVCGATALARRVPPPLTAAGALIALAVQGAGMGIQTTWAILPVAFSGYLLGGLGHGVKNVLLRTLLTACVPDRLHGRAFAAYNAVRNTAELAAIGAGGLLVNALGPRGALVIAGLGPLVAAAAGLTGLRGRRPGLAALRGPRPARRLSPATTRLGSDQMTDLTP